MIPGQKLTEESSTAKLPLGTRYFDETTGKVYYYARANEALAAADALTSIVALFDGDCDASSGNTLVDAAVTFTTATVGCYVKINVGTNSINDAPNEVTAFVDANNLTLKNDWSADLTTSEDYIIYNPFLVEKTDAAGETVVGVAPIAVTTQYYFWMQSGGYCSAVKFIGGTDPSVAHEGLVSSSTAGTLKGLTTAGTTTDEAEKANVTALIPSGLTQKVPAYLKCLP